MSSRKRERRKAIDLARADTNESGENYTKQGDRNGERQYLRSSSVADPAFSLYLILQQHQVQALRLCRVMRLILPWADDRACVSEAVRHQ
jgi:hypothetical protein